VSVSIPYELPFNGANIWVANISRRLRPPSEWPLTRRQNLEKANKWVYGKGKVLRFYDGQPAAKQEQELAVSK